MDSIIHFAALSPHNSEATAQEANFGKLGGSANFLNIYSGSHYRGFLTFHVRCMDTDGLSQRISPLKVRTKNTSAGQQLEYKKVLVMHDCS